MNSARRTFLSLLPSGFASLLSRSTKNEIPATTAIDTNHSREAEDRLAGGFYVAANCSRAALVFLEQRKDYLDTRFVRTWDIKTCGLIDLDWITESGLAAGICLNCPIAYDPWLAEGIACRWRRAGVKMIPIQMTRENQAKLAIPREASASQIAASFAKFALDESAKV